MAIVTSLSVSGCVMNSHSGPDAAIVASDAQASAARQTQVMGAFASQAGLSTIAPASSQWAAVADYGYNYVEEKCDQYYASVESDKADNDFLLAALTTAAPAAATILQASNSSASAMAIVAQSLGVATGLTSAFNKSYLFSLDRSTLFSLLQKNRQAYRLLMASQRASISNSAVAYEAIRGDLQICLPSYIEAEISDTLHNASSQPAGDITPPSAAAAFGPLRAGAPAPVGALRTRLKLRPAS